MTLRPSYLLESNLKDLSMCRFWKDHQHGFASVDSQKNLQNTLDVNFRLAFLAAQFEPICL